jgi:signal transduction histidine kinase
MRRNFSFPESGTVLRTLARWAAICLAFAGAFLLNYLLRRYPVIPIPNPFLIRNLFTLEIRQEEIGFFLQITLVPVLLMLLLTYVPYFRRLLQDQTAPHGTPGVLMGLIAVQLVSQTYEIWLADSTGRAFFIGTFVILLGSLIGGWRIGLILGAVSLAYQSVFELATMSAFFSNLWSAGFWRSAGGNFWGQFVVANVLNPHVSGGVWMAVFTCLIADAIGPRRFSPWAAAALGFALTYALWELRYAAGLVPDIRDAPAQAIVTALAAAWVMLMIRILQVEASRRKAAEAELARAEAELRALRAQINPHFFFNALNTIRYMIRTDPPKARELMIDLSEVFQRTLRSGDFIALRDELGSVEAYLSLEKARLGDRLRVEWGGVLQPEKPLESQSALLDAPVPTLALQPIVENAVIHGVGKKPEGGTVSISVERRKNDLVVRVTDDGLGIDSDRLAGLLGSDGGTSASIGLKNVDGRLRILYGPEYGLVIHSAPGSGTRVTLRIPIRET